MVEEESSKLKGGRYGAAVIGIFVFVVAQDYPAAGLGIEFPTKSNLPACPVAITIKYVTDAGDFIGIHDAGRNYFLRADGIWTQSESIHPAFDLDGRVDFLVTELEASGNSRFTKEHNPRPETSDQSRRIPRVHVTESDRDWIVSVSVTVKNPNSKRQFLGDVWR